MGKLLRNQYLNIGGLGDMSNIFTWIKEKLLWIFIIVTLFGFLFLYIGDDNDFVSQIYKALDTASAVALAFLAFVAYYDYSKDKANTKKFLNQLERIDSLNNKDAFVGIQFGGGNKDAHIEMKQFAKNKNIDDNLILIKKFGDEQNNVSPSDMPLLEKYLKTEVMPMLSGADKIHLVVAGAGIAFYVCADIFSNWKPIIIYNRNKEAKYEKWYSDNKHREKIESNLKDI